MRNRPILLLLSFALFAGLLAGCAEEDEEAHSPEFPASVDASNGRVVIPAQPARIVSLSPTATETLFEIGAGAQTVAVDDQSTYPQEAPRKSISGLTPNAEAIIGFKPVLVVVSNDTNNIVASLNAASVPVLVQPAATTMNDVYDQIIDLGIATGNKDHALEVSDHMREEIRFAVAETAEHLGQGAKPTYYHELDPTLYSVTSDSFVGNVYKQFGLRNIADSAPGGSAYPQLSAEYVIAADPELIFLADTRCCAQNGRTVAERPGWNNLDAVRHNGVVELEDDIASRWGPRIVELVEEIATALRTHHDRELLDARS